MILTGASASAARDALTQPCPVDPEHRIRPVTVDIRRGENGPEAHLLGVCPSCWPASMTLLNTTVDVSLSQLREWVLDAIFGPVR